MCGIFGLIGRRDRVDAGTLLRNGVTSLHHRGPDGQGIFVSEVGSWNVGLAHTRLSIIDLSIAGHQPMASADGNLHLAFNGEIYNYRELRRDLLDAYSFRGHSDTETILAGIQLHGLSYSRHLRGMYAYGVIDTSRRVLRLARDPFGIKPLYYYANEEFFVFASEVRAILETGLVQRRLCPDGLSVFLQTGAAPEIETIVSGVKSLGAGQELEVFFGDSQLQLRPIHGETSWAQSVPVAKRRADAVLDVWELLKDSVRHHLVSDVPVGLFLSGGIDSSALLALVREVETSTVRTFTVGFEESHLSEETHARRIAAQYDAEHTEVFLTEGGLLSRLPSAIDSMDQPTADGINTYIVSEAVRNAGVKVALSGVGGDELFCGYPSFRRQKTIRQLGLAGRFAGHAVAALSRSIGLSDGRWGKIADVLKTGGQADGVYGISRRMFSPSDLAQLLVESPVAPKEKSELALDGTNAISYLEISQYMRNTLLRDSDVMSMAHALEVRVPFVDVPLCQYVLSLPGAWKMNDSRPKPLLLDAIRPQLPGYVWNRKKMGFTLPFAQWMLGKLRNDITETLTNRPLVESCGLSPDAVLRIWIDFQANPSRWRWSRPWSLYVLVQWCKKHGVTI